MVAPFKEEPSPDSLDITADPLAHIATRGVPRSSHDLQGFPLFQSVIDGFCREPRWNQAHCNKSLLIEIKGKRSCKG